MDPQNDQGQNNGGANPPQGGQPTPPPVNPAGQTPQGAQPQTGMPPQGGQQMPPGAYPPGYPPQGAYPPGYYPQYPQDPNMYPPQGAYPPGYYPPYPPQGYPQGMPQGAYPQPPMPPQGMPQGGFSQGDFPQGGAFPQGGFPPTGGMPGAAQPPMPPEDTTPANFQVGAKLPGKLTVKVPAHALNFEEDYFIRLLAGSISLSKDEKKRIIESVPKLKQSQIDELIRIFEEEKQKFAALSKKHVPQLEKLAEQHFREWMDLETEFVNDSHKKEDQNKAEEIRKSLGL